MFKSVKCHLGGSHVDDVKVGFVLKVSSLAGKYNSSTRTDTQLYNFNSFSLRTRHTQTRNSHTYMHTGKALVYYCVLFVWSVAVSTPDYYLVVLIVSKRFMYVFTP